eukprot:GFKZ01007571.1.p1 GENE.GFKZ01007571.1~~GFKZ01007571.1.p1  ORF type:complete len:395 (+),score=55.78 GFKZ01007571.1:361-1545(+)
MPPHPPLRLPHPVRIIRPLTSSTATPTPTPPPSTPPTPKPPASHIPQSVLSKSTSPNPLHTRPHHPLNLLRSHIEAHFNALHPALFSTHTDLPPIVTETQSFDDLLVPPSHPSRAPSDTYYLPDGRLLRPHMTAHSVDLLRQGRRAFLTSGDVYRRDTVDRTHYPVFHQMDGVRIFQRGTDRAAVEQDLKVSLEGAVRGMFGKGVDLRWVHGFFPFTDPSMELEVRWRGEWLEVLGCGLLQRGVLQRGGVADEEDGWAFGMGLERLAMVLFGVPDIRLFWSDDERVVGQWEGWRVGGGHRYEEVSVYPGVGKDVAFWVGADWVENDLHEIVREVGGNLAEEVKCVDRFERDGRVSFCYRVLFRSMERNLTHVEVNELMERVRKRLQGELGVELR